MANDDVTGSQSYVKYGDTHILLECGGKQSADIFDCYRENSKRFDFPVNKLDFVFINHAHIDHTMLLPRLLRYNFSGKIICTHETALIMKALLRNSAYICEEEAKILTKRRNKHYAPICTMNEAVEIMNYVYEYDGNEMIKLNDNVSFRWIDNSHCVGSKQLELNLSDEVKGKKSILYTSDIGGFNPRYNYSGTTEIADNHHDICIMEATYGSKSRAQINKKSFNKELAKFKVSIESTLEHGGSVLIPSFSFGRTQQVLTALYELFHQDENFKYPICIDSLLSCEISEIFSKILTGENLEKYNKVINWNNVKFIKDKEESKLNIGNPLPRIVLSSSGFCMAGRVVNYLQKYLSNDSNLICFCGFLGSDESYIAYRIKNLKSNKSLRIGRKFVKNKAQCIAVNFFSSHANYDELLRFATGQSCEKIVLVHGDKEAKENLKIGIQEGLSQNDKTTKVICSQKDMCIKL